VEIRIMLDKSQILTQKGNALLRLIKNSSQQNFLPHLHQTELFFQEAVLLNPLSLIAKLPLAEILTWLNRLDEALQLCNEIIKLKGFDQDALLQRTLIKIQKNNLDSAIVDINVLLAIDPYNALCHRLRAMCLFQMDRIPDGWHEAITAFNFKFLKIRYPDLPRWQGEDITNKTLVLTMLDIRGGGDEIMFASVLPRIIDKAKICFIETDQRSFKLFQQSFPEATVFCRGEQPWINQNIKIDFHSWVREQAAHLFTDSRDFPKKGGYLKLDHYDLNTWKRKLNSIDKQKTKRTLKIGICWRSFHSIGPNMPYCSNLSDWEPIFTLPNTTFINLHDLDGADEVLNVKTQFGINIHSVEGANLRNNFDHIAGIAKSCDAVIAVPTTASMIASGAGANVFQLRGQNSAICMDVLPWFPNQKNYSRNWDEDWSKPILKITNDIRSLFNLV
jgi:tetratricopeptide (TPR) repeat protein